MSGLPNPDTNADRETSEGEVINLAVDLAIRNLHTWLPASVNNLYSSPTGQKVDCQILVQDATENEDGDREVNDFPVVTGVPIAFQGDGTGKNGFRATFPVNIGSTGILLFATRSIAKWLSGSGGKVDPELDHAHALADAVFIPGTLPFGNSLQDVPNDGASFGMDGGPQLKATSSLLLLFKTLANAQFVALSNLVDQRISTIQGKFDSHVHLGTSLTANISTGAVTGSTLVPTSPIGTLASTAATVTKAE